MSFIPTKSSSASKPIMKLTIEDKPVGLKEGVNSDWQQFCLALGMLKVGQSFVVADFGPAHRNAMSIGGYILGGRFSAKKCDGGTRVGRIK